MPEPEDVAPAPLARAIRVFNLCKSIAATELRMGNANPRAIPDKHVFMTWKRPWPNAVWRLRIGFYKPGILSWGTSYCAVTTTTPFPPRRLTRIARATNARGDGPLTPVSVWTTEVNERS